MLFPSFIFIMCGSFLVSRQVVTAASVSGDVTQAPLCSEGELRCKNCDNGQLLSDENKCDGKVDCADASDETAARCGDVICGSGKFRCAYGGCAHMFAKCNGVTDCADGSDESEELCGGKLRIHKRAAVERTTQGSRLPCASILPPQPLHGAYNIFVDPENVPDESVDFIILNYTCNDPYRLIGRKYVICSRGHWVHEFPTCKTVCKLPLSVQTTFYRCSVAGNSTNEEYSDCDWVVPEGMKVTPVCKPLCFSAKELVPMYCKNGKWNYIPKCIPECGTMIPSAMLLMAGGREAKKGELPWHVAIYSKKEDPYEQICGGSIISRKVVISAAHCFWEAGLLQPPCKYAAAAGKLYRGWNDNEEYYIQRRDVIDVKVPPRFRGLQSSFQDDIALVVMLKAFHFTSIVKPVCINFGHEFDSRQLEPGNMGKVAGWGYTSEDGGPSPVLKVAELPNVSIYQCYHDTPFEFTPYITTDKICAGYKNGTATVCRGDSGGGLSFPELEKEVTRYYIRGIVSTAPGGNLKCNTETITTFTHVISHRDFIKSHFVGFEETEFQFFRVDNAPNMNGCRP